MCTTELKKGTEKQPSRSKQQQHNQTQRLKKRQQRNRTSGSKARWLPGQIPAAAAVLPSAALRSRQNVDDGNFVEVLDDHEELVEILEPLEDKGKEILEILQQNGRFPYEMLRDLDSLVEEKLASVAAAVEHKAWLRVIDDCEKMLKAYGGRQRVSFEENIHTYNLQQWSELEFTCSQMMTDIRASWLTIKILGRHLTSVARRTDDNKTLSQAQCDDVIRGLLQTLNIFFGSNIDSKILVLLQTQPNDYCLSVILYPIAKNVHEELLARKRSAPTFSSMTTILIILFYKYWKEMVIAQEDIDDLTRKANEVLVLLLESTPLSLNPYQNTLLLHTSERLYHILRLHANAL